MMSLNLTLSVQLTYALLPQLRKASRGYMLNVVSTAAYQAAPFLTVYAASKAFLLSSNRGLRYELPIGHLPEPEATITAFTERVGMGTELQEAANKVSMMPKAVAAAGLQALFAGKAALILGVLNKVSASLTSIVQPHEHSFKADSGENSGWYLREILAALPRGKKLFKLNLQRSHLVKQLMRIKKYTSDLEATDWERLKQLIVVKRRSKWPLLEVVNAILYVLKNGCGWRDLPGEFPCWNTVHYYFAKWGKDGTWENITACLLVDYREKTPTVEKKMPNQPPLSSTHNVSKTPRQRLKKPASMGAN